MKKVTAYQTEDGKTFDRESDAVEHEAHLECEKLVDEFFYSGIRADAIACGIIENSHKFGELLRKLNVHKPQALEPGE